MEGNISEWTADVYGKYSDQRGGRIRRGRRVKCPACARGGSWLDPPDFTRSAKRLTFPPNAKRDFIGFRVAVKIN